MPINRSPPNSNKKKGEPAGNMSLNAATDTDIDSSRNLTTARTRSRKQPQDVDPANSMADIIKIITELKEEQNGKLDALQASINDIRKQNEGIIETVEFLSNEYRDLKKRIDNFETEKKDNLVYIQVLENRIDVLEKSHKNSCVEIKNIPPKQNETKKDLMDLVLKIGSTLDFNVDTNNIRDVFRINTKTEDNKPIIVDFTSIISKEMVLEHCKKFNNQHKNNKLSTSHLHISGPSKNIYISEHLTPKTRRLFFLARDFANTNEYKFCWTAGNKIYIRKREGERPVRINSESDLNQLKALLIK